MLTIAVTKFIARRLDRRLADPDAGRRVPRSSTATTRTVAPQLSLEDFAPPPPMSNTVLVLVGDLHRGVVRGAPVRADAVAQRQGGVRRDRPRADAAAGGEVGQVGDGRAARRAELALPLAARAADRVHRPAPAPARRRTTWSRSCCRSSSPPAGGSTLLHNQTALLIKGRCSCSARTSSSPTFPTT